VVEAAVILYPLCVRFDEKARENLEAAERLLPDESGRLDALSNAAASRAYYAAYLAIADSAQQHRRGYTDRASTYYRHDRFPDDARAWGIIDHDASDDLRWLYNLRIKADYHEDQVSYEEASEAFEVAKGLLNAALEDSHR
jgi:uncharacterized protein (UPF0332 family)